MCAGIPPGDTTAISGFHSEWKPIHCPRSRFHPRWNRIPDQISRSIRNGSGVPNRFRLSIWNGNRFPSYFPSSIHNGTRFPSGTYTSIPNGSHIPCYPADPFTMEAGFCFRTRHTGSRKKPTVSPFDPLPFWRALRWVFTPQPPQGANPPQPALARAGVIETPRLGFAFASAWLRLCFGSAAPLLRLGFAFASAWLRLCFGLASPLLRLGFAFASAWLRLCFGLASPLLRLAMMRTDRRKQRGRPETFFSGRLRHDKKASQGRGAPLRRQP